MAKTFFFYDLETSGLSGREDRIMQFGGIRTDMEFNQIGEPYNLLVRLDEATLPSPDALLVTGITPQQTQTDGLSEAEFAKLLHTDIFTPDTIVVGFNNIRFDDEFIRHLFWRNFYDPYEWAWKDGRSRWDLLDVVRMTRALRPAGITWPVDEKGQPTNRLELLTKVNNIDHFEAHDALSDVQALIAVAKLIKEKQPKLFSYLLDMRDKNKIKQLVNLDEKQAFVYTSGRYESDHQKTTIAFPLTAAPNGNVVVYDLRYDPADFLDLSIKELSTRLYATWEERQADDFVRVPLKELQYNRAPAIAPLGVLEQENGWDNIHLTQAVIHKHQKLLLSRPDFAERVREVFESRPEFGKSPDPESRLYDSFVSEGDRLRVESVRQANEAQLVDLQPSFQDERLPELLIHYKARNFPKTLSEDEAAQWETWRAKRLHRELPKFLASLNRVSTQKRSERDTFILTELQLWAESIAPNLDD